MKSTVQIFWRSGTSEDRGMKTFRLVPVHVKSSISCEREDGGLEVACVWILRTV